MDLNTRHKSNIFFTDQKPPQQANESSILMNNLQITSNQDQEADLVDIESKPQQITSLGMIDDHEEDESVKL